MEIKLIKEHDVVPYISIEDTIEKYGYNPRFLQLSTKLPVIWICPECKLPIEKKFVTANRKHIELCATCSNKKNAHDSLEHRRALILEWHQNNEHPLKGTKRPEHVRQALINANTGRVRTEYELEVLRERMAGEKNPFYGKRHSAESLVKMSDSQRRVARRGKDSNLYGRQYHGTGQWVLTADGSNVYMRSSWEVKVAEYLTAKNIAWVYEPERFPIHYTYKGESFDGTYCPDFLLVDQCIYIEVKGYWRDDAFDKFQSFKNSYKVSVELWDKKKLLSLGLKLN